MNEHPKLEVTGEGSPSQQVIAKAVQEVNVTDSRGRVITLKKPGPLAQYRLVEAIGDSAKNEVYMGMILPMIFISKIDGDPVLLPNTKAQVEALIQRLDDEGIDAVMRGVQEHFGKVDPEKDKEALKN